VPKGLKGELTVLPKYDVGQFRINIEKSKFTID